MVDLEQQIRAWADATMGAAEAVEGSTRHDTAPAPGVPARRWVRPVLVAAAVILVSGVVVAVVARGDGGRVRTGPAAPVTTTAVPAAPGDEVRFEVLDVGPDGGEPAGTLRAAYDADQLADLWAELGEGRDGVSRAGALGPVPDIDFDRQVVIGMTLDRPSCSSTLTGFEHLSGRASITPVFAEAEDGCRGGPMRPRYVVAVDWYRPSIRLEIPSEDGQEQSAHRLLLRQLRPEPVTVEVSNDTLAGEIHAGDQVGVGVEIENATGHPLRTTGCGTPFSIGLRRDGQLYAPGRLWCLEAFDIPTGSSVYRTTLMASRSGCTVDPTAANPDRCRADGSMPDLEPGTYEVVLVGPDGFDAEPPEATIDVVPRGS